MSEDRLLPWDPYPGTIPAKMPCAICGVRPLSHINLGHEFLASWPDIEGIDPASVPTSLRSC